jgi:hypothetical protein
VNHCRHETVPQDIKAHEMQLMLLETDAKNDTAA